jgi:hypothetical protein
MRPKFTRSPSSDSRAGSTVNDPRTAVATTSIVPTAMLVNATSPVISRPAMAVNTVSPEIHTDRPEVWAAIISARCGSAPRARSSRSRRM